VSRVHLIWVSLPTIEGKEVVQSFKNMKVVTQLVLGFFAVVVLLVGLGMVALFEVSTENTHVEQLRDHWLPSVSTSSALRGALRNIRLAEFRMVTATAPSEIEHAQTLVDGNFVAYRSAMSAYEKYMTEPEAKIAYSDIQRLMVQHLDLDRQLRALVTDHKQAEAAAFILGPVSTTRDAIEKDIKAIVDVNLAGVEREGDAANQAHARAVALVIGLIVVAVAVAIGMVLIIARSLARQLGGEPREAVALASEIAAGNLRVAVRLKAGDRSSLMYSLGAMKEQLTTIVQGIKTSGESISVAADEIAQGNTDLSQRTEEQAASLEETASSMEQLTSTVRQNADNAKQATTLATTASGIAQRGGEEVSRVVETMHRIAESSAKVAEIISVIEGIAFQTNILALNAAVEAARAGEQGRGFAVVASEVRTLAQRSASAAKEIKALISESVNRVDVGSKLVEEAGSTIDQIVQSVKRVTDIMGEISSASQEQSTGIEQVNQAVSQMDQVTQQNAALVEEASAAAHSMAEQAQALREAVAVFKVDNAVGNPGSERVPLVMAQRVVMPRRTPGKTLTKAVAMEPAKAPPALSARSSTHSAATGASDVATESDWQTF
jgi:methyl-accepting chemotaxis protein